jgi:phosphoglycolate phosphatase-like HAD superfamily hydrolase
MTENGRIMFCDFDGTIIDLKPKIYHLYQDAVRHSGGGKILPPEQYWPLKRVKTDEKVIANLSAVIDYPKYAAYRAENLESQEYHLYDALLYRVYKTLQQLQRDEYELVLVSARSNCALLIDELNRLKLSSFFRNVICGGNDKHTIILGAGYNPTNDSLIIGDTEDEVTAGKALGITTVSVRSGLRNRDFLAALQPDRIIDSFADINTVL